MVLKNAMIEKSIKIGTSKEQTVKPESSEEKNEGKKHGRKRSRRKRPVVTEEENSVSEELLGAAEQVEGKEAGQELPDEANVAPSKPARSVILPPAFLIKDKIDRYKSEAYADQLQK